MPNKNLARKQANKLLRVNKLRLDEPRANAYGLGSLSFQLFGGSYGKLFNPFPEFIHEDKIIGGKRWIGDRRNASHGEFRNGFNETRKPKPVVISQVLPQS